MLLVTVEDRLTLPNRQNDTVGAMMKLVPVTAILAPPDVYAMAGATAVMVASAAYVNCTLFDEKCTRLFVTSRATAPVTRCAGEEQITVVGLT